MILNKFMICYDTVTIFLDRREGNSLCCFVDLVDFEKYIKNRTLKWRACYARTSKTFYVVAHLPNKYIKNGRTIEISLYIHRVIMELPEIYNSKQTVDHLDHNGLNDKRLNLEVKTLGENQRNRKQPRANSSGHFGVSYDKTRNKWVASICVNKVIYNKRCNTIEEAIIEVEELKKSYAI